MSSVVQSCTAGGEASAATATFASNVTAGNTIVVGFSYDTTSPVSTIGDSLGNTYTKKFTVTDTTGQQALTIWIAKNITGGSCSVTANTGTYHGWYVVELDGVDGWDIDAVTGVARASGTTGTDGFVDGNLSAVPSTTSLFVSIEDNRGNASSIAPGTGWTEACDILNHTFTGQLQWRDSASAVTATWTVNTALNFNGIIARISPPPPYPTVYEGTYGSGSASASVALAAGGAASGDLIILVAESSDSTTAAGTPNIPTGYGLLFEETQGAGATGVTTLSVFARMVTSATTANVTIDGVGNHIIANSFIVKNHGCASTADIVVGTGSGANTGNGTFARLTGLTGGNYLVLQVIASSRDFASTAQFSAWATSGATPTEIQDRTITTGAGGGIGVAWFSTSAATSTSSDSVTIATSEQWRSVLLGFKPKATFTTHQIAASMDMGTAFSVSGFKRELFAAATVDVTPAVSPGVYRTTFATATLDITPSLAAALGLQYSIAAALNLTPTLVAGLARSAIVAANIDVTPAMSAALARVAQAAALVDLTPSISVALVRAAFLGAGIDLTPQLSAALRKEVFMAAALDVSPTLTVQATRDALIAATYSVSPTLSATLGRQALVDAALNLTPGLSALLSMEKMIASTLDAGLALSVTLTVVGQTGSEYFIAASLDASPAIAAALLANRGIAVQLDLTPQMQAQLIRDTLLSATLNATPAMSAGLLREAQVAATMSVSPAITATVSRAALLAAAMDVAAQFQAVLSRTATIQATVPIELAVTVNLLIAGQQPSVFIYRTTLGVG